MMKKHTRVLGIMLAGMMAVSTMAMVPANAANTSDSNFKFQFSHNYQYNMFQDREKKDSSSVYVYPTYILHNRIDIATMGRDPDGDNGWRVYTLPTNDVFLRAGTSYSIQNRIYEALRTGDPYAQLRCADRNGNTANGVWSPDSIGTYNAPETY